MRVRSRPRVVIVVENLPLARDHRVRKQAATLVAAGFDVSVICRRDAANNCVAGVQVLGYPCPRDRAGVPGYLVEYAWSWLAAAWLLLFVAVRTGYDALQLCGAPDIYFPLAWLSHALGKPVVYDQRDPSPETFDARYGDGGSRRLRRLLVACERATHRAADHVIVVNRTLRDVALQRGAQPASRVTIVGNGPRRADARCARPAARLRDGRPHLCLWAGIMGPQDHLDLAVQSVASFVGRRGHDDCTFVFVGDGESRAAAQQLARTLGVDDVVRFSGWQPQRDLFRYLAAADVGLETNLEPFVSPVKVMDYLAVGLPTVAFDLPETRTVAGRAAVYAPPGDADRMARLVARLLDDPGRRAEMASAGRRRFATRTAWEAGTAQRYLDVYRQLLAEPGRVSAPGR